MSNYLSQIEVEFSRGRGQSSRLSPLDWNAAQSWHDSGIPLHVVFAALDEGFKRHAAQNSHRSINSLRYFAPMVEEKFSDWKTSQTGKAAPAVFRQTEFEETMQNLPAVINDENVEIVRSIAAALPETVEAEPLAAAIKHTRGELFALANRAAAAQLSADEIETELTKLRVLLEPNLIVSVSDDERARILADTRREYGKFSLMADAEHKVLIRKIYQKFGLPELTLFAF